MLCHTRLLRSTARWSPTRPSTRRLISSLNPFALTTEDAVQIGESSEINVTYGDVTTPCTLPLPPTTSGFLYYKPGPEHAPIAGEIRFRETGNQDPSSFASGTDLQDPTTTLPWNIALASVIKTKEYAPLLPLLTAADTPLVEAKLVKWLSRSRRWPGHNEAVIHSPDQQVYFDLSWKRRSVFLAHGNKLSQMKLRLPLDTRKTEPVAPYTGACLGRFEWPSLEDDTVNPVHVHVDKVLGDFIRPKPVLYDVHLSPPRESKLWPGIGKKAWDFAYMDTASTRALKEFVAATSHLQPQVPAQSSTATERTSRSNDAGTASQAPEQHSTFHIHALRPDKLTAEDHVADLSKYVGLQFAPAVDITNPQAQEQPPHLTLRYQPKSSSGTFPPVKGFFYVHLEDPAHPVSATIRFRVTSDADPSSFAQGTDLMRPKHGEVEVPWTACVPEILGREDGTSGGTRVRAGTSTGGHPATAAAFARLLVTQNILPDAVVQHWRDTPASWLQPKSNVILMGRTPFLLELGKPSAVMDLGAGRRVAHVEVEQPRLVSKGKVKGAYHGTLLVRIEGDEEKQECAYRVLQVLDPVRKRVPWSPIHTLAEPRAKPEVNSADTSQGESDNENASEPDVAENQSQDSKQVESGVKVGDLIPISLRLENGQHVLGQTLWKVFENLGAEPVGEPDVKSTSSGVSVGS